MKPDLIIEAGFISEPDNLFQTLVETVEWDESMAARRTASYGLPYNYSQMNYPEVPMHEALKPVSDKLKSRFGFEFNNCLLNYYQTGDHRMGFHFDDTTHLKPGTGVAIVSLGHARSITYRSRIDGAVQYSYPLEPGSILYMDDVVQAEWEHAIKKQKDAGPRISLTWRAFDLSRNP